MRFSDYMAAFNRYDDAALIRDFWTDDCVMQSGPRVFSGHKGMLEFLAWAHDGIIESMEHFALDAMKDDLINQGPNIAGSSDSRSHLPNTPNSPQTNLVPTGP